MDAGATLELEAPSTGGNTYALDPLQLSGSGVNGMGALDAVYSGSNSRQGPIKLEGNTTIAAAAVSSWSAGAVIHNAGYQLTVNAAGSVNLHFLTGAGGLTVNGPGTLTFSGPGPNIYAGPTVVNSGTLMLAKGLPVQAIGGAGLTINGQGTLAGAGTIDTNVVNQGVVSPGNLSAGTVGNLIINGTYTQTSGGTLDMALGNNIKTSDQLAITGQTTLAGTLNVSLLAAPLPPPVPTTRS